jgi:hypothetical protein
MKQNKIQLMKTTLIIVAFLSMTVLFTNCKNHADQSNSQNTEQIKAEIEKILKVQDDAYAQHNEEGSKLIQSTCEDSLTYAGNDGGIMLSAYDYSHDLADGWIKRPHDKIYRIYNNTVVVSSVYKSYYLQNGDTLFINNRITQVFVRDNNQWKMAHVGTAPLPVSYFKKPFKRNSNPTLFTKYVGIYHREPKITDTVSLVDGNVYLHPSNESERIELVSLDDSTFMIEGYLGRLIFGKGANGKVTQYSYEQYDGQRMSFPKVK